MVDIDAFVACMLIVVAVSLTELRDILDDLSMVVFVIVVIFIIVLTIRDDLVIFGIVGVIALTVTSKFIVVFFFEIVVAGEIFIFIILPIGFVVNIVGVTADGDVALVNIDTFVACLLIVVSVSLTELRDILDELPIACTNVVIAAVMVSDCVGNGGETFGIVNVVVFVIVFIFMVVVTVRDDLVIFDFVGVVAFAVTFKFTVVFFIEIVVVGDIVVLIIVLPVGFVVIVSLKELSAFELVPVCIEVEEDDVSLELIVDETELLEIDDVVAAVEIKDTDLLFRELVLLFSDMPFATVTGELVLISDEELPEDAKPLLVRTIKRHNSKSMLRMR